MIKGINNLYIFKIQDASYSFFGDVHTKIEDLCKNDNKCTTMTSDYKNIILNDDCITITALFYQWLKNTNHVIDFYIEYPLYNKVEREKQIDILMTKQQHGSMMDTFIMLNINIFKNVKVHYTDKRSIMMNQEKIEVTPFILDDIYYTFYAGKAYLVDGKIISTMKIRLNTFLYIINYLTNEAPAILFQCFESKPFNNNSFIHHLTNLIDDQTMSPIILKKVIDKFKMMALMTHKTNDTHYLALQINYLTYINKLNIANKIKDYCYNQTNLYQKHMFNETYDMYINQIKQWIKEPIIDMYDVVLDAIYNLINKLVLFSGVYIEGYTLASMFMSQQQDVIVNAGASHIKHYANFFKEYLNIQPEVALENEIYNDVCIMMPPNLQIYL